MHAEEQSTDEQLGRDCPDLIASLTTRCRVTRTSLGTNGLAVIRGTDHHGLKKYQEGTKSAADVCLAWFSKYL